MHPFLDFTSSPVSNCRQQRHADSIDNSDACSHGVYHAVHVQIVQGVVRVLKVGGIGRFMFRNIKDRAAGVAWLLVVGLSRKGRIARLARYIILNIVIQKVSQKFTREIKPAEQIVPDISCGAHLAPFLFLPKHKDTIDCFLFAASSVKKYRPPHLFMNGLNDTSKAQDAVNKQHKSKSCSALSSTNAPMHAIATHCMTSGGKHHG